MAQAYKICPICRTLNHANAMVCTTCGTSLGDVAAVNRLPDGAATPAYEFRYGENDLMEASVPGKARSGLIILIVGLIFGAGLLGGVLIANGHVPVSDEALVVVTPSPRPTLGFATVTTGPPTPTRTSTPPPTLTPSVTGTPAPCVQRIVAGGSLISAIMGCGYNTLDIMPTVMALNNISDAGSLQLGQEIVIPWPSATVDPNAITSTPVEGSSNSGDTTVAMAGSELLAVDNSIDAFAPTMTPTLPAGVQWYTVESGDNIITISVAYNTNAKTLSELNREIDFARCEFGERFGGPACLVQLGVGQQLRVPAPTPLPTSSPTNDPNATATPTATATYNEPTIISPSDREFFDINQLVTLRWSPSATLQAQQQYIIDVVDTTTGNAYQATTTDIFFIIPPAWQGRDAGRHNYEWTVGIVDTTTNQITLQTDPRNFVWQGLQETKP